MSFLHHVKTVADSDKKKATARYFELVRNSAKAGPKEAEEMSELLLHAGKTTEQLDADLRIVQEVESGMAAKARIPACEKAYQDANTAHLEFIAECQKRALEQNKRIGQLIGERDQRSTEKREVLVTYQRAKLLMQTHPEIFPPDAAE